MEKVVPFLSVLAIIMFVAGMVAWRYCRMEDILKHWAEDNDYEILSKEYRWYRRGPFFWWTCEGQEVFYVTIRTSDGQLRRGWVRVEVGFWAFFRTKRRCDGTNDSEEQ